MTAGPPILPAEQWGVGPPPAGGSTPAPTSDRPPAPQPPDRSQPSSPAAQAARADHRRSLGRVLVVEDHPLLINSLRLCLEGEGYEVVAAPLDSREAVLEAAGNVLPDVVLLDVELGQVIGDSATLVAPLSRLGATVVVVSGTTESARIGAFVEEGAAGFVPKSRSVEALVRAVGDAVSRRPLMSEEERLQLRAELRATRRRNGALERLSRREAAILTGLADGKTPAEMAKAAYVSEGTVRSQIRSILTKLGVNSQLAAVAVARKAGWLQHR